MAKNLVKCPVTLKILNLNWKFKKSHIIITDVNLSRLSSNLTSNVQKNNLENEFSSSSSSDGESDEPLTLKTKLLNESLKFVPEYGWNKDSIIAGAKALGLPGISHGMLKGGADLVFYFNSSCNKKLEDILKSQPPPPRTNQNEEISSLYLYNSMKTRLEMLEPYSSKWPEAMALMALPQNVSTDINHLMNLVDTVWYYAGDKNVYTKWYTRRLSLACVYKLSELHFIKDSSENYNNTWRFLEQRLVSVIEKDNSFSEVQDGVKTFLEMSSGSLNVIGNLLGMNRYLSR